MVSFVKSSGITGIDGYVLSVESFISSGLPSFDIVGLPDTSVKESRDRVRAASRSCGFDFPLGKVTVNLAPADTKKEGPIYDLPILLSVLHCSGDIHKPSEHSAFIGELSLDGSLRPIKGALSMALSLQKAGIHEFFLPKENALEASFADNLKIFPVNNIKELTMHINGVKKIPEFIRPIINENSDAPLLDFSDVMGQPLAKRAFEIAVTGGHNILLCGSPGSGKSMMAKRISSIMPPMSKAEKLEIIRIYSSIGRGSEAVLWTHRPFRSPHHGTSPASLAGGGSQTPKPGEISLAHNGVLFLDELPEFSRDTLEILRQPLEDGIVTISRVAGKFTYPSNFTLLCAMNPCKCGYRGHAIRSCICSDSSVKKYISKISGPLLDRIDIQVDVAPVEYSALKNREVSESSADILKRVLKGREFGAHRGVDCTSNIPPSKMKEICVLDEKAELILAAAFERLGLTARSYDRVLKISRTIADLAGSEIIMPNHVAESIAYRSFDRKLGV